MSKIIRPLFKTLNLETSVSVGARVAGGGQDGQGAAQGQLRGDRPADDPAVGQGDGVSVGPENRTGAGGARGAAHVRLRRRNRSHRPERVLPQPRGARGQGHRLRHALPACLRALLPAHQVALPRGGQENCQLLKFLIKTCG